MEKQYKTMTEIYSDNRSSLTVRLETLAVTKIEAFFHDIPVGIGTGFIYKFAEHYALVTNWHVLSGIHPETGVRRNTDGLVPNRIEFYVTRFDGGGAFKILPINFYLEKDSQTYWYERAVDNIVVDIALIDLEEVLDQDLLPRIAYIQGGQMIVKLNDQEQPEFAYHAYPRVGSDVFVLGFPRGIGQGAFPIWKKGSLASEPLHGAVSSGAQVILIDTLTKDGMSGAPVLFFGEEVAGLEGSGSTSGSTNAWLVGVYAGREGVTNDENSMALGRVWKTEELEKLFNENWRRRGPFSPRR